MRQHQGNDLGEYQREEPVLHNDLLPPAQELVQRVA